MLLGRMRALAALLGAVAAATVEEPRAEPQTGGRVARYTIIHTFVSLIFLTSQWVNVLSVLLLGLVLPLIKAA